MDMGTAPKIGNAERQRRVEAKARELMIAGGMTELHFTGHSPPWGDRETKLRDAAMRRAQDDISVELGLPQWEPAGESDAIDWSQEPRPALRHALQERNAAEQDRDKAATISPSAADMLRKCEAELKQYNGLDREIEEYLVEQARQGLDDALPYHLEQAARDRAKTLDRLDRAIKVDKRLQAELRDAQHRLQQAQRLCWLWAARIVIMRAERIAAELFEAQAKADALRDDLSAYSYCVFPGAVGPPELTATLHRALAIRPKLREEAHAKIEPLKLPWLKAFAALMDDPDAETEAD